MISCFLKYRMFLSPFFFSMFNPGAEELPCLAAASSFSHCSTHSSLLGLGDRRCAV